MKKLTILLLTVLMCVFFAGCQGDTQPSAEPTESHTIAPTQMCTTEYEWAQIECEISLFDSEGNTILYSEDFTNFAVVGNTDADSYIILQLTDDAQSMLSTIDTSSVSLAIYGDTMADVKVSEDKSTVTFGNSIPFESLCEIATTIRGLFN